MITNRLLGRSTFRAPWLRLKQVIRRVTSRRVAPSRGSAYTVSSLSLRRHSSESVDLLSPAPLDCISPVSPQNPSVDPNRDGKLAITRLPPELLAQTFLLVCEASELGDYSWVVCSHICSYWRRIALDTPVLWSHLVFTSAEWVRRCISRSKSSPLIIEAALFNTRVDILVTAALKVLGERIARIALRFDALYLRVPLTGPFPMLTSLSIEHKGWWSILDIPFNLAIEPYPRLRSMSIRMANIGFLPPLPAQLVSLEIASVGDVEWSVFSDALKLLVELETLQLKCFPTPPAATSSSLISLPKLRELHLSASPACCTQFIQTLDCPCLRQWRLDLFDIIDIGGLFRIVLDNLHQSPKSMVLHREFGSPGGSRDHFPRLPNYMYPGDFQHAIIGFAYDDARNLAHGILLDIAFWWEVPLDDPSLATIFAAVSEAPVIETVQWLSLIDWNCSPQESWRPLLRRFVRMQSLVISRAPASGLLWALVKHLEGPILDDAALCPDLTEIAVNTTDCSAGGWIARQRHGQSPVNSYVDLDGARFLELLVYYLELRPIKLETLRFLKCFNYTIAEIKLLRRLVDKILWDGVGALGTTYGDNGDQFGAMTINHDLLSSRPGYEECNLTEEERWKRRWW
ncbi:hypothetical protein C8R45DRAFT_861405 [Mycena sanguinolenta]|nr:hypothetical protein C8R45DRAFT_861405 [Mycena sanguinolenta]